MEKGKLLIFRGCKGSLGTEIFYFQAVKVSRVLSEFSTNCIEFLFKIVYVLSLFLVDQIKVNHNFSFAWNILPLLDSGHIKHGFASFSFVFISMFTGTIDNFFQSRLSNHFGT